MIRFNCIQKEPFLLTTPKSPKGNLLNYKELKAPLGGFWGNIIYNAALMVMYWRQLLKSHPAIISF